MFTFWQTKNLINEQDCEWIFSVFSQLLRHFDSEEFNLRTKLIQPTDAFFPGKCNDPTSMANNVFNATLKHSGLQHWPFNLQHDKALNKHSVPALAKHQALLKRNSVQALPALQNTALIAVYYNPHQTTQPGDLAASFSHVIAQHLFIQSQLKPVGGDDLFAQNTEILAVVMGFGVMLSNSAYAFRGSCARCFNPQAHRQASLSEDKVIFAFTLFCQLKGISKKEATQHLKPYLRSLFKQANKQIQQHPEKLKALMEMLS